MLQKLQGDVGLIFTSRPKKEVIEYFKNFQRPDFAKSGFVASEDIILQPGPLNFPAAMMDQLRKLGMVVEVDDTKVILRNTFRVSTAGQPLTPEQAKVLVHLDIKTVNFKMNLSCVWSDGKYQDL